MILNLDVIEENVNRIKEKLKDPKVVVPPVPIVPHKADIDEDEPEENSSHPQDTRFIKKCYKYLRKLGYVDSQYQFSEQFLNKNKYYFGMVLCESRHPSLDALHNLLRNISGLNDGLAKSLYLVRLYEEGEKIITQRLFRYF
ncbi:MAG: hypothetical protein IKS41_05685 [Alphaproteobacteria bacterium]|nr:hypothetical protein [Alphaproteobacteria bacterium]